MALGTYQARNSRVYLIRQEDGGRPEGDFLVYPLQPSDWAYLRNAEGVIGDYVWRTGNVRGKPELWVGDKPLGYKPTG